MAADLTGKTWQLTAITEKVPAFQGVVPAADQANYTIEFKSDGTFDAKADCNQMSGTYTTTSTGGLTIVARPDRRWWPARKDHWSHAVRRPALGNAASYAIAERAHVTITLKDEGNRSSSSSRRRVRDGRGPGRAAAGYDASVNDGPDRGAIGRTRLGNPANGNAPRPPGPAAS